MEGEPPTHVEHKRIASSRSSEARGRFSSFWHCAITVHFRSRLLNTIPHVFSLQSKCVLFSAQCASRSRAYYSSLVAMTEKVSNHKRGRVKKTISIKVLAWNYCKLRNFLLIDNSALWFKQIIDDTDVIHWKNIMHDTYRSHYSSEQRLRIPSDIIINIFKSVKACFFLKKLTNTPDKQKHKLITLTPI